MFSLSYWRAILYRIMSIHAHEQETSELIDRCWFGRESTREGYSDKQVLREQVTGVFSVHRDG
jgi:hypothetical protein